jgi:hypothetical protein
LKYLSLKADSLFYHSRADGNPEKDTGFRVKPGMTAKNRLSDRFDTSQLAAVVIPAQAGIQKKILDSGSSLE